MPCPPRADFRPLWQLLAGILLCLACAAASIVLADLPVLRNLGMGPLTLAIVFGMAVGNSIYPRFARCSASGVEFSKQRLLRLGIVLYGLRLTLHQVTGMGVAGVLIDLTMVLSTFAIAVTAGTRWLGMDRGTATLVGIGSAICGAAAVMAAEPVIRARNGQASVAIATVVVFGTVALFLYPLLWQLNSHLHLLSWGPVVFGRYVGSTVHEVAQAVAAGRAVSTEAADAAVVAKMVRVMMLAPFLLVLARLAGRPRPADAGGGATPGEIRVPWFAFCFTGMVVLHSLVPLPATLVEAGIRADGWLLATAMSGLGLTTSVSAVRRAGHRPLLLAAVLFAWLTVGGVLVNLAVQGLAGTAAT